MNVLVPLLIHLPLVLTVTIKPWHVWPLSNLSLYDDVVGPDSTDMHHDPAQKCFSFIEGPTDLPYAILDTEEQAENCFDVNLSGKKPLHDLTISMYIFPDNDVMDISGTILHYQTDDREIMRIRTLANTFLASFRDEYGMSAGTMYVVNMLTPYDWNHVVISRDYKTGRIIVYKDGEEVYNDDDEFSDIISFPSDGLLRVGKSQDPDDEAVFEGSFACIQVYEHVVSAKDLDKLSQYCLPENWDNRRDVYYEEQSGKTCLAERPRPTPPPEKVGPVVTMTTVTRQSLWEAFLEKYGLSDSGRLSGTMSQISTNQVPEFDDELIGTFNATESKVCVRLCMRVDGCKAMAIGTSEFSADYSECRLYDDIPVALVGKSGFTFYKYK